MPQGSGDEGRPGGGTGACGGDFPKSEGGIHEKAHRSRSLQDGTQERYPRGVSGASQRGLPKYKRGIYEKKSGGFRGRGENVSGICAVCRSCPGGQESVRVLSGRERELSFRRQEELAGRAAFPEGAAVRDEEGMGGVRGGFRDLSRGELRAGGGERLRQDLPVQGNLRHELPYPGGNPAP